MTTMELRENATGGRDLARIARFVVAGSAVTALYYGLLAFGTHTLAASLTATTLVAFPAAHIVSYLLNTRFVFRSTVTGGTGARYLGSVAIAFAIALVLTFVLERLGAGALLVTLALAAVLPVVNYTVHRLWTYRVG
jgi:putative flippase GtrA